MDNGNFVSRFIQNAKSQPEKLALQIPQMEGQVCLSEETVTYGELANLVSAYQSLWQKKGFKEGDKVIVILTPSKDSYAIALSLFSLGIIAVFIDTGMGRKKIQMAIRDSNAKAIISMTQLIKLFWFIPSLWPLQRYAIDGSGLGYKNLTLQVSNIQQAMSTQGGGQSLTSIARSDSDHGLISFTSGSTGRPKGADRTHYSLIQQHLAIRDHWPDEADDIDCPCFPVMVLHNLSCGMTTIMPKVDLAQPSEVNAALVVEQIRQHKITRLSGAPAYINALVNYLHQQPKQLKTVEEVKGLVVGGATVSKALASSIKTSFPLADARIVYGSTEAEPISDVSIDEYLAENEIDKSSVEINSSGYLVGHVASQIDLLISNVYELESSEINESQLLDKRCETGEIGEILVSGDHVLKQYIDNPSANRENKIPRANVKETKSVWHRTGDCGYQDAQGRLWLSGRVKDTVRYGKAIFQPYPIEQQMDQDKDVQRSAIIHANDQVFLFIQLIASQDKGRKEALLQRLINIANVQFNSQACAGNSEKVVDHIQYVEIDKIPVDGRHNSKIDRPLLRELLEKNKIKNSHKLAL